MARPSKNTDARLIQAGRRLMPQAGVSGLSLRQVAEEAGVNLGMFHYHFKTKDEFAQHVLQGVYDEFFATLEGEFQKQTAKPGVEPLETLRSLLLILGTFAFANRELLSSLMKDLLSGEKVVAAFMAANAPRHIGLLISVVVACQERGLIRKEMAPQQVVVMAAASIATPAVIGTAIERAHPDILTHNAKKLIFSPDVIEVRVDTILRGLMP